MMALYRTSLPVRGLENFRPMDFFFDRVYYQLNLQWRMKQCKTLKYNKVFYIIISSDDHDVFCYYIYISEKF